MTENKERAGRNTTGDDHMVDFARSMLAGTGSRKFLRPEPMMQFYLAESRHYWEIKSRTDTEAAKRLAEINKLAANLQTIKHEHANAQNFGEEKSAEERYKAKEAELLDLLTKED